MNIAFDTYDAIKAITETGLTETQAETIVTTINNAMNRNLATKADIASLQAGTKTDIAALQAATKADMVSLQAKLEADMVSLQAKLELDMASLKSEMLVLKWMVGLVIAVEVLPLLKVFLA